jgi:hypothetical protein
MKTLNLKNSQAIRFMTILPTTGQTLYGINLVRAFEARYGFFESPKTVEEFDLKKGVTFRHGIFAGRSVIDKAMVYYNGMLAAGTISTTECYDFISDVIEWASKEAGITIETTENSSVLYTSTLEVEAEINFEKYFGSNSTIGQMLSDKLATYGAPAPRFEVSGLIFQSSVQTPFRIERLVGAPASSNAYFSTAPLATLDHIEVLTAIEAAFKA